MRTVNYHDVLNGSAAMSGMGPAQIGVEEFVLFRQFHDRRLQEAWEAMRWPDICPTEQRFFRPRWEAGINYAAGREVFFIGTGKYYQSLRVVRKGLAPEIWLAPGWTPNLAYWAESAPTYNAIDYSPASYTVGMAVRNPDDGLLYQCHTAHVGGAHMSLSNFGVLAPFVKRIDFVDVVYEEPALSLVAVTEVVLTDAVTGVTGQFTVEDGDLVVVMGAGSDPVGQVMLIDSVTGLAVALRLSDGQVVVETSNTTGVSAESSVLMRDSVTGSVVNVSVADGQIIIQEVV